jgi:hypothetical protein
VTIVDAADKLVQMLPTGDGGSNSIPPALGDDLTLMATKLAALEYPRKYQHAAQVMVAKIQSLATSFRSGQVSSDSGSALIAAVSASQQFYKALGIPSVCTTTSGG